MPNRALTEADVNKFFEFRGKRYQMIGYCTQPTAIMREVGTPIDEQAFAKDHSVVMDAPIVEEYKEVDELHDYQREIIKKVSEGSVHLKTSRDLGKSKHDLATILGRNEKLKETVEHLRVILQIVADSIDPECNREPNAPLSDTWWYSDTCTMIDLVTIALERTGGAQGSAEEANIEKV